MFLNRMPRFEVLSDQALATIGDGWERLAQEVGIRFDHPRALELFAAAGQTVDGEVVRFDPGFLRHQEDQHQRDRHGNQQPPLGHLNLAELAAPLGAVGGLEQVGGLLLGLGHGAGQVAAAHAELGRDEAVALLAEDDRHARPQHAGAG